MKRTIRRKGIFFVVGLIGSLLTGCLALKQETIVIRFDDPNQITALFVYEGLHASGDLRETSKEKALAEAKQRLAKFAASSSQFMLIGNWFGFIDLRPEPADTPSIADYKRMLTRRIIIKNGSFLLNGRKELSGYQTITIPDVAKFVEDANALIGEAINDSVTTALANPERVAGNSDPGPESLRLLQRAARDHHRWLEITPGEIEVNVPLTREDADKMVVAIEALPDIHLKRDFPNLRIRAGDKGLTLTLGDGKAKVIPIAYPRSNNENVLAEAELLDYARTLPTPFDSTRTIESLIRTFSTNP